MHWAENVIFLIGFLLYEFTILLITYVKVYLNILRASEGLFTKIFYVGMWMVLGIGILICFIAYDLFSLIRILCMHNGCQHKKHQGEKDEDDEIGLKLVIYNDMRDAIIKMYIEEKDKLQENMKQSDKKSHKHSPMSKVSLGQTPGGRDISHISRPRSALDDKTQFAIDENDDEILQAFRKFFIVKKLAILDAWRSERASKLTENKNRTLNIRADRSRNDLTPNISVSSPEKSEIVDELQLHPSEQEEEIASSFIDKFIIQSESSVDGNIDLSLMLRALPDEIKEYLIPKVELYNFSIFQESLLAHQNKEIVEAFEYFDQRNKDRVYAIKGLLLSQKTELGNVKQSLTNVQRKLAQTGDSVSRHHLRRAPSSSDKRDVKRKLEYSNNYTEPRNSPQKRPGAISTGHKVRSERSYSDSEEEKVPQNKLHINY